MNDPIFNQLLELLKNLSKAMKDIKQIIDDLDEEGKQLASEIKKNNP